MVSHRDKAVSCDECGLEFPDGRALINHRHSHNKEPSARQFSCAECGKTFGSRSSQQIHARIHTGERPYGCRFCWKAFADGGTLRKHERIHTGEKPYACAVCPRAFNQRVSQNILGSLTVRQQGCFVRSNFVTLIFISDFRVTWQMFSATTQNGNVISHTAESCEPGLLTVGHAGLVLNKTLLKIAFFWNVVFCS
jgi:ribosomal protein L34E